MASQRRTYSIFPCAEASFAMTMSNARAHEDWAARLLAEFLTAGGQIVKKWERGADPPDFVFFVNDEQWAVEVTRADQRVRSADGGRSRTDADTKLGIWESNRGEVPATAKAPIHAYSAPDARGDRH